MLATATIQKKENTLNSLEDIWTSEWKRLNGIINEQLEEISNLQFQIDQLKTQLYVERSGNWY